MPQTGRVSFKAAWAQSLTAKRIAHAKQPQTQSNYIRYTKVQTNSMQDERDDTVQPLPMLRRKTSIRRSPSRKVPIIPIGVLIVVLVHLYLLNLTVGDPTRQSRRKLVRVPTRQWTVGATVESNTTSQEHGESLVEGPPYALVETRSITSTNTFSWDVSIFLCTQFWFPPSAPNASVRRN